MRETIMPVKPTEEMWRDVLDHWRRMFDDGTRCSEGPYSHMCAFCRAYKLPEHIQPEDECRGCPIYAHTGKIHCKDTPYKQADDAYDWAMYDPSPKHEEEYKARVLAMYEWLLDLYEAVAV